MKSVDAGVEAELAALEAGDCDPAKFPHGEHVRLAYEMLGRHSFGDTVSRFSQGLRRLAGKAGRPSAYHDTITVAFLALIAERRAADGSRNWEEFIESNRDLLDKTCLTQWYDEAQLGSPIARETFCLPHRARTAGAASRHRAPWLRADRVISGYALVFSAYIAWLSFKTAAQAYSEHSPVLWLAVSEIAGTILFVFRGTRLAGLGLLLLIFGIAATIETISGGSAARLFFYSASALLVWLLSPGTRRRHVAVNASR